MDKSWKGACFPHCSEGRPKVVIVFNTGGLLYLWHIHIGTGSWMASVQARSSVSGVVGAQETPDPEVFPDSTVGQLVSEKAADPLI
ncbi:hypothetical protein ACOMHN_009073 [Nucella lapillus]